MYTVVGVNPSINVYKIQDAVGHTRVVHRNLLLEVNFLPLPGLDQAESADATDQSWGEEDSDEEDCVADGDEMASVSGELTQGEIAKDVSDSRDDEELSISSLDDSPVSELAVTEEHAQPSPALSPAAVIDDCPTISVAPHRDTLRSQHADTSGRTDSHAHTEDDGTVRTRAGRLVKSVNRLIESMVQKPFFERSKLFIDGRSQLF